MDIKKRIKEFIIEDICAEANLEIQDFDDDEQLVKAGILDSLAILKLISFLDEELDIDISADEINPENFATLNIICERIAGNKEISMKPSSIRMPGISEIENLGVDLGLKDRVVLVTGSSRGLGETMVKLFGLHGCRMVVNYFRGQQDAGRVVDEIKATGGKAFAVGADVSDPQQVEEMVKRVVETYGTVNVLVNNAVKDFKSIDFTKLTWADMQDALDVVVKGAFNCCKAVIPVMLQNSGGKIVNIGTLATDNPPPNQLKYVVSKSGLVGFTRGLAIEFASRNIQVNMVSPSFVETDLTAHIPGGYREKIARETPMRRNASPIEVAQAVVYLASSYASFTTGQKIMVTGGGAPFL